MDVRTETVEWMVKTIKLAQKCQKTHGMAHPLNVQWSDAINSCCAEIARRVKEGDREAMAARL